MRESAEFVTSHGKHVKIDEEAIQRAVCKLTDTELRKLVSPANFDAGGACGSYRWCYNTHFFVKIGYQSTCLSNDCRSPLRG